MPIMNEDISTPPVVMLAEYLLQYPRLHMEHLRVQYVSSSCRKVWI